MTRDDLTKEQLSAIKSLERALKKVANAGIGLYGMDDSLLAYIGDGNGDAYGLTRSGDDSIEVENHGAYIDSGGH